jgi:hypothetical protein
VAPEESAVYHENGTLFARLAVKSGFPFFSLCIPSQWLVRRVRVISNHTVAAIGLRALGKLIFDNGCWRIFKGSVPASSGWGKEPASNRSDRSGLIAWPVVATLGFPRMSHFLFCVRPRSGSQRNQAPKVRRHTSPGHRPGSQEIKSICKGCRPGLSAAVGAPSSGSPSIAKTGS